MYRKILVGVDGSPISNKALDTAIAEAVKQNGSLHIVHAMQLGFTPGVGMDPAAGMTDMASMQIMNDMLQKQSEVILQAAREKAEDEGLAVQTHLVYGDPREEILNVAKECGCNLIVVGSAGKGFLDTIFIGSVSRHIIEHSPVDTLVVRADTKE